MTGRKSAKNPKKKGTKQQQQPTQGQQQSQSPSQGPDDPQLGSPPPNIKKEPLPQPQVVKKILKAETDEAKTLKIVFKSNPDTQMKEFIKRAATKPNQTVKAISKTPAENHPAAVAQELLDTDDDVADNLARLFKTSKSYKNL